MADLVLYIGNKNYSSWSFRSWLAMDARGIPFQEHLIPFDFPAGNPKLKEVSPTGRVPLLQHGALKIWESLSIIEYLAEIHADAGMWPCNVSDRAIARSISMEMASGFRALRNACPMNIRRRPGRIDLPDGVMDDVARIRALWHGLLAKSGGPFLFGDFSAADAMFAPVVNRFSIYELVDDSDSLGYMQTMQAHPSWIKWRDAALQESWLVPEDEV
ncbi:glutathione S-transferase family protein [Ciceribacter sp. L1K22]|uniref:glutathione S-transferase family protein n=1 Tax=Ciceribacter sp. L1K22 TaxID=2820275 RepID=UPI001ABE03BB|nr:glutathione S-transferase family protein [Ciceribacter sp. L1K22]MBO3761286.1 glutathione S-transferase family protein [Ciceribacter sp. L1K22]